jgi:hypothetical protein
VRAPSDADRAIVARERAVAEYRMREQVRGGHRGDEAGFGQRGPEPVDVPFPGGVVAAERDHVVVVERDAPRAEFGQPVHGFHRVERGARRVAERVGGAPADGPQAERESVFWSRFGGHGASAQLIVQ